MDELRVLLAGSNLLGEQRTRLFLERRGLEVAVAESGSEVVDCYVRDPFDVIVVDTELSETDRAEVAEEIRRLEARSEHPVGILGLTESSLREERENEGFDGRLDKPFEEEDLIRAIRGVAPEPESGNADSDDGLIDFEALVASLDGDEMFAYELLDSFSETYPDYCEELTDRLAENDAEGARDAAHQLKGSLHAVRADQPASLAEEVELAARDGDLPRARKRMAPLEHLLEELGAEIARRIESH